MAQHVCEAVTT